MAITTPINHDETPKTLVDATFDLSVEEVPDKLDHALIAGTWGSFSTVGSLGTVTSTGSTAGTLFTSSTQG